MSVVVSSRVRAVTAHPGLARVVREVRLTWRGALPAEVRVAGLPLGLDDGSLGVSVEQGDVLAHACRVELDDAGLSELEGADERLLREARREEARLGAKVAALETVLATLGPPAIRRRPTKDDEPVGTSPTEARLELLAFRSAEVARLRAEIEAARREHVRARKERESHEERDRRARVDPSVLKKAVRVSLAAGRAGGSSAQVAQAEIAQAEVAQADDVERTACLVLEYQVPGVRWSPAYTLRVERRGPDGASRAELALRAVVAQQTGEDWQDVSIALSTSSPSRVTSLPELSSQRLGRAQPAVARRGFRPPPEGTEALFADYDRARARLFAGLTPPETRPEGGLREDWLFEELSAGHDAPERGGPPEAAAFGAAPVSVDVRDVGTPRMSAMPAPPAALPMAPQSMARKSAGIGALFGGLGGAPAPPVRARATPAATQAAGGASPAGAAALAPRAPSSLEPRLTDHGALRLLGADEPGRGTLFAMAAAEAYVELSLSAKVRVSASVVATAIAEARSRASSIASLALPPSHREPSGLGGFDFAYEGAAPVSLPSDGAFHAIPVLVATAPVTLQHVCVPREASQAYRVVELVSPMPAPLLEGPLDVYLDGVYLVTTTLRATPEGGRVEIGMGVDPGIKVARNATFGEQSVGLMGGSLALRHDVKIELVSHLGAPTDVEVRERLPVAREKDPEASVEVVRVEPLWAPWEPTAERGEPPLEGGHAWRVRLGSGERRELSLSYVVKIASKHELVGGNRREP